MTRVHVFDRHLDAAHRWLAEIADQLDLPAAEQARALHALRAGLHAVRDCLPPHEVLDLAAQLPALIRGLYIEGWTLAPKRLRHRAAVIARVEAELVPDVRLDPVDVLRAVVQVLVEHVTDGEIADVVTTLPKPVAALWHDLTGHALLAPPIPVSRERFSRRTGYSR